MARFSSIARGTRAVRPITVTFDGQDVPFGLRVLSAGELAGVMTDARAFAKERGVEEPHEGEPLYDLGLHSETLAVACVDVDDPTRPFFAGAQQIRADLSDDQIHFIYESYLLWKDEAAPQKLKYSPEDILRTCAELGVSDDPGPFYLAMRPGLRLICMRFLASQWLTSLKTNLDSTSDSDSGGMSTTPRPQEFDA